MVEEKIRDENKEIIVITQVTILCFAKRKLEMGDSQIQIRAAKIAHDGDEEVLEMPPELAKEMNDLGREIGESMRSILKKRYPHCENEKQLLRTVPEKN